MQDEVTVKLQKEKYESLFAKFSHELRNPVALINSELQMISSSHRELTSDHVFCDVMENLQYIRELLDEFSDLNNAGKLCLAPTHLTKFLQSIAVSEKPVLDYLGIALETDIPADLPVVDLDRRKMKQAFLNLFRNAEESISHSHGRISLRAACPGGRPCISMEDNGCGIDAEQLEKIFTPFVTFKTQGTGLGLAVARQIIESHGGRIEAASIPRQGTIFRIFLG